MEMGKDAQQQLMVEQGELGRKNELFNVDLVTAIDLFENDQLGEASRHFEKLMMTSPLAYHYAQYLSNEGYIDRELFQKLPKIDSAFSLTPCAKEARSWFEVSIFVLKSIRVIKLRSGEKISIVEAVEPLSSRQPYSKKEQRTRQKPINIQASNKQNNTLVLEAQKERLYVTLWNWTRDETHPSAPYTLLNLIKKKVTKFYLSSDCLKKLGIEPEMALAIKAIQANDPRLFLEFDTCAPKNKREKLIFLPDQKVQSASSMLKYVKSKSMSISNSDLLYELAAFYKVIKRSDMESIFTRYAAYLGNSLAQMYMAENCSSGELEGHFWIFHAAVQGDKMSQVNMSHIYREEKIVKKRLSKEHLLGTNGD